LPLFVVVSRQFESERRLLVEVQRALEGPHRILDERHREDAVRLLSEFMSLWEEFLQHSGFQQATEEALVAAIVQRERDRPGAESAPPVHEHPGEPEQNPSAFDEARRAVGAEGTQVESQRRESLGRLMTQLASDWKDERVEFETEEAALWAETAKVFADTTSAVEDLDAALGRLGTTLGAVDGIR
jgi:hypothetical protein